MRVSESFPLLKFIRPDKPFPFISIVLIAIASIAWVGTGESAAQSRERSLVLQELPLTQHLQHNHRFLEHDGDGAFLMSYREGERVCEVAPPTVAAGLATRIVAVNRINHLTRGEGGITQQQPAPLSGLRIVLRGTQQLEEFPQAKQAFLRAAATWERIIESPISMVVDVDFGPRNFGNPFPQNAIGSTRIQIVGNDDIYDDVREELVTQAQSPAQASVIRRLPTDRLPTDVGAKSGVFAPTPVFRALGLIPPIADPEGEEEDFGKPPAIGFNSANTFDFNAADGIDANKIDFEAAALHEIGHALGFYSRVGGSASVQPSVWDFFRLRPDTDMAAFGTAERILRTGGMQAFLAGRDPLALSTGNSQGQGGDGRQASHWKDDLLNNGNYIGIMDPTASPGDHDEITENDLYALATMGFRIRSVDSVPTTELLADDGGLDTGVAGAGVIIVNRLTPSSYPARLEAIRINFAQFKDLPDPSGAAIRLVAFAGASGATSPQSNPVLLVNRPEPLPKISNAGGFVEFKIRNGPVLNEGDFYVGFQAPEPAGGVVFSLDEDEPKNGRSFYSLDDGSTYRGLTVGTPAVTYNAMIRALVSVERGVRVEATLGRPGETVDVPITLLSKGSERAAAFTLDFDPAVITLEGIESGESGITLQTAGSGTSGHFGVTAFVAENQTFAPGRRRLAVARFRINAGAGVSVSSITLGNQPIARRILGTGNNDLTESAIFTGGTLAIAGKVVGASAASYVTDVLAPGSLVVGFGTKLSVEEAASNTVPLPHVLVGTTVRIRDRENREFLSQLFYVSSGQVNFLLPAALALGPATLEISSLDGNVSIGVIQVEKIAPGLFSANSTGRDVAAGNIVRVRNGQQITEQFARFDSGAGGFVPIPIDLGPEGDQIYLVFYGTGIRNRDLNGNVTATMGGVRVDVTYASSSPPYVGLDQVNTGPIPRSLAGRGEVEVALNVDGKEANRLKVVFK